MQRKGDKRQPRRTQLGVEMLQQNALHALTRPGVAVRNVSNRNATVDTRATTESVTHFPGLQPPNPGQTTAPPTLDAHGCMLSHGNSRPHAMTTPTGLDQHSSPFANTRPFRTQLVAATTGQVSTTMTLQNDDRLHGRGAQQSTEMYGSCVAGHTTTIHNSLQ